RTRWAPGRASTFGTAAGRSAANTMRRCWSGCAPGKRKTRISMRGRPGVPRVEIGILTSGCRPAEVARHPAALHLAPAPRIAVDDQRPFERHYQGGALGALEQEPRFPIVDRIDQPTGRAAH